jgi:chromosome partitioning protein
MHTVAVFTTKGGAGKSALTVFLAEFLATAFGKRVLVVDLDPQQSASFALLGEDRLFAALEDRRSLAELLMRWRRGELTPEEVEGYVVRRPEAQPPRGKTKYLQALHVIASDREAWHDLDAELSELSDQANCACYGLLRGPLQAVRGKYDVCLIDFPGQGNGRVVGCGLYASDWWLLPVQPDRMGARDLDRPLRVIQGVERRGGRKMRMLGTVLSMCQNRAGGQYKKAKRSLTNLAAAGNIPELFSRGAEIDNNVDAKNALDDTLVPDPPTLGEKFGGATRPFFKSVRQLTEEVLERPACSTRRPPPSPSARG